MSTPLPPAIFEQLKVRAATAALFALDALESVIRNPESKDADRIKAANQIIVIMDKATDHLDIMAKYDELKHHLNEISDRSEYDPEP